MIDPIGFAVEAMEVTATVQRVVYARGEAEQVDALDAMAGHGQWAALHAGALLRLVAEDHGPGVVERAIARLMQLHWAGAEAAR